MKKLFGIFLLCILTLTAFGQRTSRTSNRLIKQYHKEFNVRVYGATGDGVTDDTEAIQAAIDAGGSNCKIIIPTGDYVVTSTLTISSDRVNIVGDGKYVSYIVFRPGAAGDTTLFLWEKANGSVIVQCSISQLGISEGDNYTKTAFRIVDADIFNMDNIAVYPWFSTNHDAIVLHTQGRDLHSISNVDFFGDRPVFLDDNPNSTIDLDHYSFYNCYLIGFTDGEPAYHPLIEVNSADTINISYLTFSGSQAWVGGTAGFYWDAYVSNQVSYNISFNNVRFEQGETNAWCIYINHDFGLQEVQFNNVLSGLENGFYLRNITGVSFKNISHWANASNDTALNIDNTVHAINFNTVFFQQNAILTNTGAFGLSGGWRRFAPNVTYPYMQSYIIPTVENLLINPSINATQPYSQISSPSVTVATTDSAALCGDGTMGFLFVSEKGNGFIQAIYSINYNSTAEISDPNAGFSITRGGDDYNIYFNSDTNLFYIENNKAGSAIFTITFIGIADIN